MCNVYRVSGSSGSSTRLAKVNDSLTTKIQRLVNTVIAKIQDFFSKESQEKQEFYENYGVRFNEVTDLQNGQNVFG